MEKMISYPKGNVRSVCSKLKVYHVQVINMSRYLLSNKYTVLNGMW